MKINTCRKERTRHTCTCYFGVNKIIVKIRANKKASYIPCLWILG